MPKPKLLQIRRSCVGSRSRSLLAKAQAKRTLNRIAIVDFLPSRLADFVPSYTLKSSVAELRDRVEETEEKISKQVSDLQSTVLIGLSIVFAGLTIVATLPSVAGKNLEFTVNLSTGLYLMLSTVALILSLFAIVRTRNNPKDKEVKKKKKTKPVDKTNSEAEPTDVKQNANT